MANHVPRKRKRIWVQHVAVEADKLETRVQAAGVRGLDAPQEALADGVRNHLRKARDAAFRDDPIPGRWANWWRGTLVEAAYRNLHAARAQIVDLIDENELQAEIPFAVARAQSTLHRDDPRRIRLDELRALPVERLRPRLRRLMDDSYQKLDDEHAQLRSFRNIVLLSAFVVTLLVGVTLGVVSQEPSVMPLCFPSEGIADPEPIGTEEDLQNCPTGEEQAPSGGDILVVALIGALGGALAAAVSIRNLKGTSTAYDVPVALAMLKVPLGAFTAILALVAIQGDFVPGLSALDSQEQILAYALVFGFAQQVFTRLLDQRAQTLLEGLPGGTAAEPPPRAPAESGTRATPGRDGDVDQQVLEGQTAEPIPPADVSGADVEVLSSDESVEAAPEDDELQDDEVSPADETGEKAEGPS